jgi:hypothetical protein
MPWLNLLWPLLDEEQPEAEPDYKRLYLWLDRVTIPKYGMDSPFLSLANRRRIWGGCEQPATWYFRRLYTTPVTRPDSRILEGAICRNMVILCEKEQPESSWVLQRTLFIYSKDELANKPVTFEAYWRNPGELVGLCAVFGQQRRVFGLTALTWPTSLKQRHESQGTIAQQAS